MAGLGHVWKTVQGLVAAAATAGAALVMVPAARAQFGAAGGFADAFEPDFIRRDVRFIVESLELDEGQRLIVETFFDDYQNAFEEGLSAMRERMTNMRDEIASGDPRQIMEKLFRPVDEWRNEKITLKNRMLDDIKTILSEVQLAEWDSFERKLVREKSLHKGRLSGETLDLFQLLREAEVAEPVQDQIKPVLDEYEVKLDVALRRRDRVIADSHPDLMQALRDDNPQIGLQVVERQVRERVAVRDVNDTYAGLVAAALPEGLSGRFRDLANQRSHPRVFRPTAVNRIFDAARELPDLQPATLEAIVAIESAYNAELARFNEQLVKVVREHEPVDMRRSAETYAARMGTAGRAAAPERDPVREEFRRRDQMALPYVIQLRNLLTPEQFAALPGAARWLENETSTDKAEEPKEGPRKRAGTPPTNWDRAGNPAARGQDKARGGQNGLGGTAPGAQSQSISPTATGEGSGSPAKTTDE
jgi:hypothetical protein